MTDLSPLTDDEAVQLKALWARQSAVNASTRSTADRALGAMVASAEFQAGYDAMKTALAAKPAEVDLSYAVASMRRLIARYGGMLTD
jgi:hypothetical protein